MVTQSITRSRFGQWFIRVLEAGMESRLRYRFFGPLPILRSAEILPGQIVLEVGCGTGYFTQPAAGLIGPAGRLVAMDVLPESVELVWRKVQGSGLKNIRLIQDDALDTGLRARTFDRVLLFGVIPSPMLPLRRLLPEMQRLLKPEGILAVWPPIPGWLPEAVLRSRLFRYAGSRNGVHEFKRDEYEPCGEPHR